MENERYCHLLECYQNALYFSTKESFKISVEVKQIIFVPKLYLSCTLLHTNQTSVYHNQLSVLEDDVIVPDHRDIPPIQQKELFWTNIDSITRRLTEDDFLDKTIFPVFSDNKIGFQCISPTQLVIDTVSKPCGPNSLEFIELPKIVKHN